MASSTSSVSETILNCLEIMGSKLEYSISPLKIICCDGQLNSSFSHAKCETIHYIDWLEYLKKSNKVPELPISRSEYNNILDFLLAKKIEEQKKMDDDDFDHEEETAVKDKINVFRFISLFNIKRICNLIKDGSDNMATDWQRNAVKKLETYFATQNKDRFRIEKLLGTKLSESEYHWSKVMGNHLLIPLTVNKNIQFDNSNHEQSNCKCPCEGKRCDADIIFSDTSMGNPKVWHGTVDILIGVQISVVINSESEIEAEETNDLEENIPRKGSTSTIKNRPAFISQNIVFAHCRKGMAMSSPHLVPNVIISPTDVKIFMYDVNHDILLESSTVPLTISDNDTTVLNDFAIIMIWLCLNWRHFCSGVTKCLKEINFTSDFRKFMERENALPLYDKMVFGSVRCNVSGEKNYNFKKEAKIKSNVEFLFPASLSDDVPLVDECPHKCPSPKRAKRDEADYEGQDF